jgi:hypothetical protein
MFVVIFFLLGLVFGFTIRLPWALVAFIVPVALLLAATDRSIPAIVIGFAATGIGLLVGLVLATRVDERTA